MSTIGLPPSLLTVEPPAVLTPLCQERLLRNRRASPSIRKCSRPTLMVGPATLRSVIRCKRRVHMCGSIFSTAGVSSSGGSHRRRSAGHPAACFGMDVMMMDEGFESESMLRSEEHTSELQSRGHLVCRVLLEKKKEVALNSDNLIC